MRFKGILASTLDKTIKRIFSNLSDYQRFELIQWKKEQLLQKGQEKQKETQLVGGYKSEQKSVLPFNGKTEKHNTQKELAEDLGWSTGKIAQADIVNKEADEEI
jgi:hypothetical protein